MIFNDASIDRKLDTIIRLLCRLLNEEYLLMKTIDDLANDVQAETTVSDSIETLVKGLSDQVAALKTTQTDPATASKIDALAQQLEANTAKVQAAVSANTQTAAPSTPAGPAPTPSVPNP